MESPVSTASALTELSRDGWLLFAARFVRLFAYGLLAVVLVLYLNELGLSGRQSGLLLTLTLLGDTAISLWMATLADRIGRRRMLLVGAGLMLLAALSFASTENFLLLLVAATIGVISPSGNEVGPFLSVEQAALSQIVSSTRRTSVFAWYNLIGFTATALGSFCGGQLTQLFLDAGYLGADAYRPAVIAYGLLGLVMGVLFLFLSPATEVAAAKQQRGNPPERKSLLGLHQSRGIVAKLSALFALDAFAGGFIIQSLLSAWLHARFELEPATLGWVFLGANLLSGVSALAAGRLANRFGLINTMVFTHLPSNVLLMLLPLMPSAWSAIALLLLRHSISQMDVPTRQSYTMAVVHPDERSAAAGITAVARSIGASASPWLAGLLFAHPALRSVPFFIAGGIKIAYDLCLYVAFSQVQAAAETKDEGQRTKDE